MTQQLMSSPSSIQSPKVEVTNAKGHRIELPLKRLSSFYVSLKSPSHMCAVTEC